MSVYFDTCVWLTYLQDERYKNKFLDLLFDLKHTKTDIYVSTIVLKEISFKTDSKKFKSFFSIQPNIVFFKTVLDDYNFGREIEDKVGYEISFYDCLHIAICKRLNLSLITSDKDLIKIARKYIEVYDFEKIIWLVCLFLLNQIFLLIIFF